MKVFYFLILMALDKKVQIKKTALQACLADTDPET